MRELVGAVLIFFYFISTAQLREYNTVSISDSIYQHIYRIECKLYENALNGTIRAYRSDSLKSYYNIDDIKNLNVNKEKDLKGLYALYHPTALDINNIKQAFTFKGIALLYEPHVGSTGIVLPDQPMFYIKLEDIKNLITISEMKLIVNLSNLLLSDKEWPIRHADNDNIITPKELYYCPGCFNRFGKFAIMNKESLKYFSDNIRMLTSQFVYDGIFKFPFYREPLLKNKYSLDSFFINFRVPHKLTYSTYPEDHEILIDTTIFISPNEGYFTTILWNTNAIGIRIGDDENTTIYIHRHDFVSLAPKWLSEFLLRNL